jgi:hypothetical protein
MINNAVYDFNDMPPNLKQLGGFIKHLNKAGPLDEGWIAGGFARFIYRALKDQTLDLCDYFTLISPAGIDDSEPTQKPGDVDIFFPKKSVFLSIISRGRHGDIYRKSFGGFAYNESIQPSTKKGEFDFEYEIDEKNREARSGIQRRYISGIKVQFVHEPKLRHSSIQETFESFDMHNCCYAIKLIEDTNKFELFWTDEAVKADADSKVWIQHTNSPFLLWRINKYIKHRGLKLGLYESSYQELRHWFMKVALETQFDKELFNPQQHFLQMKKNVKDFHEKIQKIENEDLLLFMGKWTETHTCKVIGEDYGKVFVTDWARSNMV